VESILSIGLRPRLMRKFQMNQNTTQHTTLWFALCLMCAALAAPLAAQDLQGGKLDSAQSGLPNTASFITSTCIYTNCTLTITNGSTNPTIRTVYNPGTGSFTLQCQNSSGAAVGTTINIISGHLLSGTACPASGRTLNLVCSAPPCPYDYVP